MRVLVTGGAGFIGSHLCEKLVVLGSEVVSLDNYSTGSRSNHVSGVRYLEADTSEICAAAPGRFDLVFHLGKYASVEQSFDDLDRVWVSNILGTRAVLEFCRAQSAKLVYAGSSTKFGDGGLGRNQSPYGWTKASNTELVMNYGAWFGLDYAITYFYNAYGPREIREGKYATLIARFAEKMRNGETLTVVAPGTQRRNFTYVGDIVSGLIAVAQGGRGDEFGIGSPESYSVMEVAEMFGGPIELLPERRGNRMTADLMTTKTEVLGWRCETTLDSHIEQLRLSNWSDAGPKNA